jgi:uncharacterized repeat protein (TIGR03803 family)
MRLSASLLLSILFNLIFFQNSNAQGGQVWGMAGDGGPSKIGMIFKSGPTASNKSIVHNFTSEDGGSGSGQTQLLHTPGGLFYGVLSSGGINGLGVIYTYDPVNNAYAKKADFTGENGKNPLGTLTLGSNGKIYGTVWYGGSSDKGGIFEYNPASETLSLKIHFTGIEGQFGGCVGITEGADGKFYGVRYNGGSQFKGVIFVFDPVANTYSEKFHFTDDAAHGRNPMGVLFPTDHGTKFFGTTESGASSSGVIFKYDPVSNTFTKKFDITGTNGAYPRGYFTAHPNGKLYGVTQSGGTGTGVLFEYDTINNVYQKKADFGFNHRANVGVAVAENGKIYGMTQNGGLYAAGSLFEFDPLNSTYEYKYSFNTDAGDSQYATVALGNDGKLYAMTTGGSVGEGGFIFSYDIASEILTKKIDFNPAPLGAQPYGTVTEGNNGKLYGVTAKGGENGYGVLFELNPSTNEFSKKVDFDGTNGKAGHGSLLLASNGNLYGTTRRGGTYDNGVLFEYNSTEEVFTVKMSFPEEEGGRPEGNLIEGAAGKLYGLTPFGGASGPGVVFEYDIDNDLYTKKADFNDDNGSEPKGGLCKFTNGKFYGLTYYGGTGGYGVLFDFDPESGELQKKIDFNNTDGANPVGDLLLASNGNIYGVTSKGGANDDGVLFEYIPESNTYTVKYTFNETTMGRPGGTLIESSNGKLYGMSTSPSDTGEGAIFEYTLASGAVKKASDFTYATGSPFIENSLSFVKSKQALTFPAIALKFLGEPPFALPASTTSGLTVVYESSNPEIASVDGNMMTIHKTGTISITASQPGNAGYKPASSQEQSLVIKLATPSPLTATAVSKTGFTLSWKEVVGATQGYLLDVSTDDFSTFIEGYNARVIGDLTIAIAGLNSNTAYKCRVRAVGDTETSENTDAITVVTILAPIALDATNIGEHIFTAHWNTVEHATSYLLDVSLDNFSTFAEGYNSKSIQGASTIVSGLKASTEYKYRVRAANANGASSFSNIIMISTLVPSIEAPIAREVNDQSQVDFKARWSGVSKATNYSFELSADDFNTLIPRYDPKIVADTFLVVNGLTPNISYKYRVKAANDDLSSQYSNVISVSTLEKITQTISFAPIEDQQIDGDNFRISATASSGLPVIFSSTADEIELTGSEVKILKAGTVTITASQSGNEICFAATSVSHTFCINPEAPFILFSDLDNQLLEVSKGESEEILWLKDDVVVGEDETSIKIQGNGLYTAEVIVDGCNAVSDPFSVLITGSEHSEKNYFEVHPNPVSERLTIVLPDFKGVADVRIIGMNGIEVHGFKTSKIYHEIDAKHFAPGVYVVSVTTEAGHFNNKFVKK